MKLQLKSLCKNVLSNIAILCTALTLPMAAEASNTFIEEGVYKLKNHPDGNAAPPTYGLRLDELINVTRGHDIFTFDFNDSRSDMKLTYDGNTINIWGVAFGGLDRGGSYDPHISGLYEIDFTYGRGITVANEPNGLEKDLLVQGRNASNRGFIRSLDTNKKVNLYDYAGSHNFTFRFGNGDNDAGHRGFDGINGWGWLNHTHKYRHVNSSDWLFTAHKVEVPEPGTYMTLAACLMVANYVKRRKQQAILS